MPVSKSPVRKIARGHRNNNPGNVRKSGNWKAWQGIAPDDQQIDDEFIVFKTAAYGIRAMVRTLITYRDKYNLRTIAGIIGRWAPPNGRDPNTGRTYTQDTTAYAMAVSRETGFAMREPIDVADYATALKLVPAIIRHELGYQPYSLEQIQEGLRLAGIQRPVPKPSKDPQLRTGAVAGAGAAVVVATEAVQLGRDLKSAGEASESSALTIGGGIVIVLALGALAIGVLKKRRAKQE